MKMRKSIKVVLLCGLLSMLFFSVSAERIEAEDTAQDDSYTVTLHAGEGKITVDGEEYPDVYSFTVSKSFPYITKVIVADADYSGKMLEGWYTDASFSQRLFQQDTLYYGYVSGDLDLYAKYEDYVTITYDFNGGYYNRWGTVIQEEYQERLLLNGEDRPKLYDENVVHPDRYALNGWVDQDGNRISRVYWQYRPDHDVTLTAQWTDAYIVTLLCDQHGYFDYNSQYENYNRQKEIKVAKGKTIGTGYTPNVLESGWIFDAYYEDPEYTSKIDYFSDYRPKGDVTLYGRFVTNVTITFDANGGYFDDPYWTTEQYFYKYGDRLSSKNIRKPMRDDDLAFAGWSLNQNGSEPMDIYSYVVREETTVYAVWQEGHTVNLYAGEGSFTDGTKQKTFHVCDGGTIYNTVGYIDQPSKANAKFAHWYTSDDYSEDTVYPSQTNFNHIKIYEDLDLYADYTDTVRLTLVGNGGFFNYSANYTTDVAKGTRFNAQYLNEPVKEGYAFAGWYDNAEATGDPVEINGYLMNEDTTLYASYVNGYRVTYHGNGGYYYNGSDTVTYYFQPNAFVNDSCGIQAFSRDGYLPTGFYLDEQCSQEADRTRGFRISQDIDYYVGWTDDLITVTFDTNGGFFTGYAQTEKTILRGSRLNTSVSHPVTFDQKAFAGWESDVDGYVGYDYNDLYEYTPSDTTVLRALWTDDYYTVTIHAKEGHPFIITCDNNREVMEYPVYVHKGRPIELNGITYSSANGPTFTGWYSDPQCTDLVYYYDSYAPKSDMDLYAGYRDRNEFTITYRLNGGYIRDVSSTDIVYSSVQNAPISYASLYKPEVYWPDGTKAFAGFSLTRDGEVIADDYVFDHNTEIYALYTDDFYTITIDYNGGYYLSNAIDSYQIAKGKSFQLSAYPYRSDDIPFMCYNTERDGSGESYSSYATIYPQSDMTLYAIWEERYHSISFVVPNGTINVENNKALYQHGTLIRAYGMFRPVNNDGLAFVGWYDNEDYEGEPCPEEFILTEDIILYAKFDDMYTVWLLSDDHTFADGSRGKRYRVEMNKTLGDLEWPEVDPESHYQLDQYWTSEADGTGKRYSRYSPIDSDLFLYAVWYVPSESMTVTAEKDELLTGEELQLMLEILPEDATHKEVIWSSSDPSIASVDQNGHVSALQAGTVTIIAHGYDQDASIILYVSEPVVYTVRFDSDGGSLIEDQHIPEGEKASRPEDPVRAGYQFLGWYLNDDEFDFDRVIDSDLTLLAKWEKIIVVSDIELESYEANIVKSHSYDIVVTHIEPEEAADWPLTYVSDDESIATVSGNGHVVGISEGTTYIRITSRDGNVTVSFMITVRDVPDALETEQLLLRPSELIIRVGEYNDEIRAYQPEDLQNADLIWSSQDETVVTVDENGRIRGESVGTTTVKAVVKGYDENALEAAVSARQNEYDSSVANVTQVQSDVDAAAQALDDSTAACETVLAAKNSAADDLAAATTKLNGYISQRDSAQSELTFYQGKLAEAQQAYADAQNAYNAARADGEAAKQQRDRGSVGFFEYNGSQQAIDIINQRVAKQNGDDWGKTYPGAEGDATSLDNMRVAILVAARGNELRASDNNNSGVNKEPLLLSNTMMAIAQVQANASASKIDHSSHGNTPSNNGLGYNIGENLAFEWIESDDPYDGWYKYEKLVYDYIVSNGGNPKDYNTVTEAVSYLCHHGMLPYAYHLLSSTGHYTNLANPANEQFKRYTQTGVALCSYEYVYPLTYGQVFALPSSYDPLMNDTTYTPEEYLNRFDAYLNDLDVRINAAAGAKTAMEQAQDKITEYQAKVNSYQSKVTNYNNNISDQQRVVNQKQQAYDDASAAYESALAAKIDAQAALTDAQNALTEAQNDQQARETALNEAIERLNHIRAFATVIVNKNVSSITIYPENDSHGTGAQNDPIVMDPNEQLQLQKTIEPADAESEVTWSSNDPGVAAVDSNGKLTAIAGGTAVISARTENGVKSADLYVSVRNKVSFIALDQYELRMKVNDTFTLQARVRPENADNKVLTYSSANSTIASVDSHGTITAKKAGTTTVSIEATDGSGVTATVNVIVSQPVTSIVLEPKQVSLLRGKETSLNATVRPSNATNKAVTWTSSNIQVATVDDTGKVTAVGLGTTIIRAKAEDGSNVYDNCTVRVVQEVTSIRISEDAIEVQVNKTMALTASVLPENAGNRNVVWSSADETIATVNSDGVVTGVKAGTTSVRATAADGSGVYAEASVTVTQPVTSLKFDISSLTIAIGQTEKLNVTVLPSNATNKNVIWLSLDEDVVTVDQDGNIEGLAVGTTTVIVTATDGSGKKATCQVTVLEELIDSGYVRIYRESRLSESIKTADELKKVLGIEKFSSIVVAKDSDFADALSGSYLAARKNAPILLVNNNNHEEAYEYIRSSLKSTGTVYILGGDSAVSYSFEENIGSGVKVKRIEGSSRYTTNLDILTEAGMSSRDIFVVTGSGYADSLSSASAGLPILMVDNTKTALKNSQIKWLRSQNIRNIYVLGQTASVNASLEKALKSYCTKKVIRLGGSSRWETTKLVADQFFPSTEYVVLATGNDFADGLIASPLAYALKSPLLMVANGKTGNAKKYVQDKNVTKAYIIGSKDNISDETARKILMIDESTVILER